MALTGAVLGGSSAFISALEFRSTQETTAQLVSMNDEG